MPYPTRPQLDMRLKVLEGERAMTAARLEGLEHEIEQLKALIAATKQGAVTPLKSEPESEKP